MQTTHPEWFFVNLLHHLQWILKFAEQQRWDRETFLCFMASSTSFNDTDPVDNGVRLFSNKLELGGFKFCFVAILRRCPILSVSLPILQCHDVALDPFFCTKLQGKHTRLSALRKIGRSLSFKRDDKRLVSTTLNTSKVHDSDCRCDHGVRLPSSVQEIKCCGRRLLCLHLFVIDRTDNCCLFVEVAGLN